MNQDFAKPWWKIYNSRSASRGLLYIGAMSFLIENANMIDEWCGGIKIERGQLMASLSDLSSVWEVSVRAVRTILANLEKDGFLTIKGTNKGSIITILNFDIYRSGGERPTNN